MIIAKEKWMKEDHCLIRYSDAVLIINNGYTKEACYKKQTKKDYVPSIIYIWSNEENEMTSLLSWIDC